MDLLFIITSVFFFIFLIRNTLFWLHLWQIKEYRLDRVLVHLKETAQGRNLIWGPGNIAKSIAFFSYIILGLSFGIRFGSWFDVLFFLVFFASLIKVILEITNKTFRIPILTAKIITIFFIVIGLELLFLFIPMFNRYFWLLFLDRIAPILIAFCIGVFGIPSDVYKDILIGKSTHKIRNAKDVLVIGITGSYGKGSTKEFLSTVLSSKWNVLRTQGTYNTPIGIAKTILSGLNSSTEIFIVEMGAYKRGEIAQMCEMVQPKIGILTSVNDQHISLFGSLENIKKTKYELIESLPEDGLALFNGNNTNSFYLSKKTKKKKVVYYADYDNSDSGKFDIRAFNIRVSKFDIDFDVELSGKTLSSFKVNLIGKQSVENILPAIYLAHHLGMKMPDIKKALIKIVPIKKTMEPFIAETRTVFIDDTFNANPSSVIAAVEYMRIYRGKKILILQPMIELGENAFHDHFEVAQEVGKVCDYLIVTNRNFYDAIENGIRKSGNGITLLNLDPLGTAEVIKKLGKNDVVVFEGKEAQKALKLIEYRV